MLDFFLYTVYYIPAASSRHRIHWVSTNVNSYDWLALAVQNPKKCNSMLFMHSGSWYPMLHNYYVLLMPTKNSLILKFCIFIIFVF